MKKEITYVTVVDPKTYRTNPDKLKSLIKQCDSVEKGFDDYYKLGNNWWTRLSLLIEEFVGFPYDTILTKKRIIKRNALEEIIEDRIEHEVFNSILKYPGDGKNTIYYEYYEKFRNELEEEREWCNVRKFFESILENNVLRNKKFKLTNLIKGWHRQSKCSKSKPLPTRFKWKVILEYENVDFCGFWVPSFGCSRGSELFGVTYPNKTSISVDPSKVYGRTLDLLFGITNSYLENGYTISKRESNSKFLNALNKGQRRIKENRAYYRSKKN